MSTQDHLGLDTEKKAEEETKKKEHTGVGGMFAILILELAFFIFRSSLSLWSYEIFLIPISSHCRLLFSLKHLAPLDDLQPNQVSVVGRNVSKVVDPVGNTVGTILSPVGAALNGVLRPITDSVGSIIKPLTVHPDESEIKKKEKERLEKEWGPTGGKRQTGSNPLGLSE